MKIEGNVENIIFRNESNGYTVLSVRSDKAVFTLFGNISNVNSGEKIDADVLETVHPIYGTQYKINSYMVL